MPEPFTSEDLADDLAELASVDDARDGRTVLGVLAFVAVVLAVAGGLYALAHTLR